MMLRINAVYQYATLALLLAVATLLHGCATNDELFAQYDSGACLLDVSALQPGNTAVAPHNHPNWVPAVYFGSNEDTLTDVEKLRLQTTLSVLKRYPQLLLGLQGYTDSRGSAIYNLRLADRRIASVAKFLVENGLQRSRIISQPLGVGLPQIGKDIKAAQATNRRVGLNALDISGRPVPLLFPSDSRPFSDDTDATTIDGKATSDVDGQSQPGTPSGAEDGPPIGLGNRSVNGPGKGLSNGPKTGADNQSGKRLMPILPPGGAKDVL